MRLNVPAIKIIMARGKISQQELGQLSGISRQSVCMILARGSCSIENAGKLADALGVDVKEICAEEP